MPLYQPPLSVVYAVEYFAPGFWKEFIGAANAALSPGDQVTSWWRSRAENERVEGSIDSQHLVAAAFDVVPGTLATTAAKLRRYGFTVVQYPTHLHAQAWPAGVARASGLLDYLGL